MQRVIGLVGNFHTPSLTYRLVEKIVETTAHKMQQDATIYNLSSLGSSFPIAQQYNDLAYEAKTIIQSIIEAQILVIGVPTWNSSYPGMFKHLFDLLPPTVLVGKPVILSAVGGSDRHMLMLEYQLRPLLNYFRTCPVNTSIYVTARDFKDGEPSTQVLDRINQAVDEVTLIAQSNTLSSSDTLNTTDLSI